MSYSSRQPDFQSLFESYFASARRPLKYSVRTATSDMAHDLQFVASLVALATLRPSWMRHERQRLSIPLIRLCSEIPTVEGSEELAIQSRLVLRPVVGVAWTTSGNLISPDTSTQLEWICVAADYWDHEPHGCSLVILGDEWQCTVELARKDFSLVLADEGEPAPARELLSQSRP